MSVREFGAVVGGAGGLGSRLELLLSFSLTMLCRLSEGTVFSWNIRMLLQVSKFHGAYVVVRIAFHLASALAVVLLIPQVPPRFCIMATQMCCL